MHKTVSFNYGLLDASEPVVPVLASAAQFGKGVFTTIAIHDREAFLWKNHWRRLEENAARLGIDLSEFTEAETTSALDELLAENSVDSGRARITFLDETAGELWPYESRRRTSLLIASANFRPQITELRLGASPYEINSTSPLTNVKSCNYLEKILALDEAKTRRFDEAIQLNEGGEITSACMANVFWLHGGTLFTPSLKTGCLAGTTREFVLDNLECEQVESGIAELRSADAIFLTSAGVGVIQVAEFDGRHLKREPHPIMKLLPPRR